MPNFILATLSKDANALFVSRNDIQQPVIVQVFHSNVQAYARIAVDLVPGPARNFSWFVFKPINHRWLKFPRIVSVVGKISFSCYKINVPVAINVCQCQAVCLRECVIDAMMAPRCIALLVFAVVVKYRISDKESEAGESEGKLALVEGLRDENIPLQDNKLLHEEVPVLDSQVVSNVATRKASPATSTVSA